jgi:hypothetical protein
MLEHHDDELVRQLRQQRSPALHAQLGWGRGPGEESSKLMGVGGRFRGLLGVEALRRGGALAGGGAESGEGGVGHLWTPQL